MFRIVVLFLSIIVAIHCKPLEGVQKVETSCGYESCHDVIKDKLNVHLVPHSHDDVGWLKTIDQYFYGNNIKNHKGVRGVQNILDTVIYSLQDNPDRRFIQVETVFFAKWFDQQSDETKEVVKSLVNNGQLEMVSGGWSMNDEATTNYQAIIDQFTLGLRTLNDSLGECAIPRVGWQIDPFGHTNMMATVFAQLGFDGLFFTRLDYRDVLKRHETNTSEFIWRGNADLGEESDIFTSLIYRDYSAPLTFCWDVQCNDLPIIDNKNSFDYNVDKRVEEFADYIYEQAKYYTTNNILITMGGDFTYQSAHMYYTNIDKLIKGFKEFKKDINLIYSTPSCYIKAVKDASESKQFSVKTDDFIPYASDDHSYWTGFYSSRPTLKRLERLGNNLLQVGKQLVVQANANNKNFDEDLNQLKNVMGIMQHHDAITGTEKQHVSNDYTYLLTNAMVNAEKNISTMIFDILKMRKEDEDEGLDLHSCLMSNATRCTQSNLEKFTVAVYNPHSQVVSHYVRLPVPSTNFTVQTLTGYPVPVQISPNIDTFDDLPGKKSLYQLTFYADNIPPIGVKFFYVIKNDNIANIPNLIKPVDKKYLGTNVTGFSIDDKGFLNSITINEKNLKVKQEFLYYQSENGTSVSPSTRASGAYVFRPIAQAIAITDKATTKVYEGELFDEVHQVFNKWIKQVIRVYKSESYIEFNWVVGPLENFDKVGIEVITRFVTNIQKTDNIFYTDSNGRELVKRVLNHRETFNYTNEEPISGNYYPITSRIVLKSTTTKEEFVILNDRAQGGSSLKSGEVELMIHRRLMSDDKFGVNEVLNEMEFDRGIKVTGQHYLVFADDQTSVVQQRNVMKKTVLAPWIFVGNATEDKNALLTLRSKIITEYSCIRNALPENVRILTLEKLSNTTLLLRLEHLYGKNEHKTLSNPVTVDLKELFSLYNVLSAEETTLGANQWKKDNQKLPWSFTPEKDLQKDNDTLSVTLNPIEIKTFILQVEAIDVRNYSGTNIPHLFTIVLFALYLIY